MWAIIISFLLELIKSPKKSIYGSIAGLIGVVFIIYSYGYVQPIVAKISADNKIYNDSIAHEQKLKETMIIQKLENINENINDLKDDNKEIKQDIKGLLRRR